jgi:hypothetical protein
MPFIIPASASEYFFGLRIIIAVSPRSASVVNQKYIE